MAKITGWGWIELIIQMKGRVLIGFFKSYPRNEVYSGPWNGKGKDCVDKLTVNVLIF